MLLWEPGVKNTAIIGSPMTGHLCDANVVALFHKES